VLGAGVGREDRGLGALVGLVPRALHRRYVLPAYDRQLHGVVQLGQPLGPLQEVDVLARLGIELHRLVEELHRPLGQALLQQQRAHQRQRTRVLLVDDQGVLDQLQGVFDVVASGLGHRQRQQARHRVGVSLQAATGHARRLVPLGQAVEGLGQRDERQRARILGELLAIHVDALPVFFGVLLCALRHELPERGASYPNLGTAVHPGAFTKVRRWWCDGRPLSPPPASPILPAA
jgi:hypothetical protein